MDHIEVNCCNIPIDVLRADKFSDGRVSLSITYHKGTLGDNNRVGFEIEVVAAAWFRVVVLTLKAPDDDHRVAISNVYGSGSAMALSVRSYTIVFSDADWARFVKWVIEL